MRIGRLCIGVAVAAGLAGCGTASNSTTTAVAAAGGRLTVYASVPSAQSDVFDGEQLALQASAGTGRYKIQLKRLTADSVKQITDNARTADNDKSTIAYLGESVPGTSGYSVPITNELGILQVSPTDNSLELIQGSPVLPESRKSLFYPSESTFGYTFARVVPSAVAEAKALVAEMASLHVSKLYVAAQRLPCTDAAIEGCYGKAIAHAVMTAAQHTSIAVQATPAGADGAFVATNSPAWASSTFSSLASGDPGIKLFGPSTLATPGFTISAPSKLYVSVPGPPRLPAGFSAQFRSAYGHAPSWQALYGYLAMTAVLDAIHQAGGAANNRTTVTNKFFGLSNQPSPLGSFTMTVAGDIQLPAPTVVIDRYNRGGQLVPLKAG
jgi:ABC-type branched-subunit amino acid transport system substrate-binding protein